MAGLFFEINLTRKDNRHRSTVRSPPRVARRKAPKIIGGRKAGNFISGRRAGKDHARSQCPLRGERSSAQCSSRASRLRWPVALSAASSDFVGQTKTIEKERSGEVRCAHERREKKPVRLATSNSVTPTKLVVGISILLLHGSRRRTENHSMTNQFLCSFQRPTCYPQRRSYNSQLVTCILQLILCSFQPPIRYPRPRLSFHAASRQLYGHRPPRSYQAFLHCRCPFCRGI